MSYRSGVRFYTTGRAEIEIHFPENNVCCMHCWMAYRDSMERYMCRWLNREIYRPRDGILMDCPLHFENEKQEENEDVIDF